MAWPCARMARNLVRSHPGVRSCHIVRACCLMRLRCRVMRPGQLDMWEWLLISFAALHRRNCGTMMCVNTPCQIRDHSSQPRTQTATGSPCKILQDFAGVPRPMVTAQTPWFHRRGAPQPRGKEEPTEAWTREVVFALAGLGCTTTTKPFTRNMASPGGDKKSTPTRIHTHAIFYREPTKTRKSLRDTRSP